jgi:hypothetical protein
VKTFPDKTTAIAAGSHQDGRSADQALARRNLHRPSGSRAGRTVDVGHLGFSDRDAMYGMLRQLARASVSGQKPDAAGSPGMSDHARDTARCWRARVAARKSAPADRAARRQCVTNGAAACTAVRRNPAPRGETRTRASTACSLKTRSSSASRFNPCWLTHESCCTRSNDLATVAVAERLLARRHLRERILRQCHQLRRQGHRQV